jgi:geranylgeranyl pyrophosphate synthase
MNTLAIHEDAALEQGLLLSTDSDIERARDAARHLILSGGKRIRPRLAMLVARAVGLDTDAARCIGTAAELVHSATLLHDDVIDRSDTRRGQPTVSAKYGTGSAILTGDFLLAQALMQLTEAEYYLATRELSRAVRDLAEAEILQLQQAYELETTLAQSKRIASGKTASLFAWCARAVALTADSPPSVTEAANRLGRLVGYAFQVADDLLDFMPTARSGKPGCKDLSEGQITVPMQLVRLKHPGFEAALTHAFNTRDDAAYAQAYEVLAKTDAIPLGLAEIKDALAEATAALNELIGEQHDAAQLRADFQQFIRECTARLE